MTETDTRRFTPDRPCPIPGHPQDDEDSGDFTGPMPESAWARYRAWQQEAPERRRPVPLALSVIPVSALGHGVHLPGAWTGVAALVAAACGTAIAARHNRAYTKAIEEGWEPPPESISNTEAAVISALIAGWFTAAVIWGPFAGPYGMLGWAYIVGVGAGYIWLRGHRAITGMRERRQAAEDWIREKAEWHELSHRVGLGGYDLQEKTKTHIGYRLLLTGPPTGTLTTQIAKSSSGICERIEHVLGLPYNRVDIRLTQWPGQLVVDVRLTDPSVRGAVIHPYLDPDSEYAGYFPETVSIRDLIPWGVVAETGEVAFVPLWTPEQGGRTIGIYANTGWGKTTLLNLIRERVTRMPDARLIQINGAKVGDETTWADLAVGTAAGSIEQPGAAARIMRQLEWLKWMVTCRSLTHVTTGDSVFQPTAEHPALIVIIDEIDEVMKLEGAASIIDFLASKQRSEAITLLVSSQRATQKWGGGAGVQANIALAFAGRMTNSRESKHISSSDYQIPDITQYVDGEKDFGYWQVWNPFRKQVTIRARSFDMGKIGQQGALVAARLAKYGPPGAIDGLAGYLDGQIESTGADTTRPLADHTVTASEDSRPHSSSDGLRARLAAVTGGHAGHGSGRHRRGHPQPQAQARAAPAPPRPVTRMIPGVPGNHVERLMAEVTKETSAQKLADVLEVGKTTAHKYLTAAVNAGAARKVGAGRGSRYVLPGEPGGEPAGPQPEPEPVMRPAGYTTIHSLMDAVESGELPVDDETREVLARARAADQAARADLRLVATGTDGEGDEP